MTRIDFYLLPDDDDAARRQLVCRLAEKAVTHGQRVFVHADEPGLLATLDDELWSFRAESFVPHRLLSADESLETVESDPVQLSTGHPPADRQVLINLAAEVPAFFSRFSRTLEVVNQAAGVREAGRDRYRYYQQRGYPLQHHKM